MHSKAPFGIVVCPIVIDIQPGPGILVMMMDVEKVLSATALVDDTHLYVNIHPVKEARTVFFVDDSVAACKQIERTLDAMNIKYIQAMNGLLSKTIIDVDVYVSKFEPQKWSITLREMLQINEQ